MRMTATLRLAVALMAMCLALPVAALAAEAVARPAADGVFAAFKTYPLVGLGDRHSLAEEGEFYRQLVRDPRFAAQVGNVVFESASSAHQATLDRYLNGAEIPRAELRKVWTDVVGGAPFLTAVMYQQFLAEVRAVNLKLPAGRRIKVWAGEPAVDWATITTNAQLEPYRDRRDDVPAAIIEREILGRGKKALVIYGGLHFSPLPSPPGAPSHPGLKGLVEAHHPGAFFIVEPYAGFIQPGCSESFEAQTRWPTGSLVTPIKGTAVEALLLRPDCTTGPPPMRAPGAAPMAPEELARMQAGFARPMSSADADALLYLGPAASLTQSPDDPELLSDPAFAAEVTRRLPITGAPPDLLRRLSMTPRPYRRPMGRPPQPAGPPPLGPAPG